MSRLEAHLRAWLGQWPPRADLDVVAAEIRTRPGWDGQVRPLLGVGTPDRGTVLSVTPEHAERVAVVLEACDGLTQRGRARVAEVLGGGTVAAGVLRVAESVPGVDVLPDAGAWVEADDARLPGWLRPFNGGVLLATDTDDAYVAGVGVKRHDDVGHELSVGTDPDHRGRGLARRLVAQAARELLAGGAAVTYLHAPDNAASSRVAEAAGFPDHGWRVWGLFQEDSP